VKVLKVDELSWLPAGRVIPSQHSCQKNRFSKALPHHRPIPQPHQRLGGIPARAAAENFVTNRIGIPAPGRSRKWPRRSKTSSAKACFPQALEAST